MEDTDSLRERRSVFSIEVFVCGIELERLMEDMDSLRERRSVFSKEGFVCGGAL
jgi:hypothetical protein